MDVSSLAGRVISQPVSTPLQDGLGFFHHLTPYLPQHALRLACPKGEGMGLPRSAYLTTDTLGPLYLPAGMLPVSDVLQALRTTHLPFGSSLTAPLACQYSRQLQVFTSVDHSILS
jgi:hypothetical protein